MRWLLKDVAAAIVLDVACAIDSELLVGVHGDKDSPDVSLATRLSANRGRAGIANTYIDKISRIALLERLHDCVLRDLPQKDQIVHSVLKVWPRRLASRVSESTRSYSSVIEGY